MRNLKKIAADTLRPLGYQITKLPGKNLATEEQSVQAVTESNTKKPELEREFDFISKLPGFLDIDAYGLFRKLGKLYQKKSSDILEVGIFCGKSYLALAIAFKNTSKAVGVDPFYENFKDSPALEDEGAYLEKASRYLTRKERLDLLNTVLNSSNYIRPDLPGKFEVKEMTQEEYLKSKPKTEKFDVVHIDGEHTYKAVYDFLNYAGEVLNPATIVVIDDFMNPGFPGIAEAVHTHRSYKKQIFPIIYAFNKAVFLYRPNKNQGQ